MFKMAASLVHACL